MNEIQKSFPVRSCTSRFSLIRMGFAGLAATLLALGAADLRAQETVIAYSFPTNLVGNQNVAGAILGYDFDVANEILVTRLGIFDDSSDGLKLPLVARIWDRDALTEVASMEFTPEAPGELIGGARFKALPQPLRLASGFRGTVTGEGFAAEERIFNSHGNPAVITWDLNSGGGSLLFVGTSRYGSVGDYPATADGGPAARFVAGTFEYQTTPLVEPGRPALTVDPGNQQILLSWPAVTAPAAAAKYTIERATSPTGTFELLAETTGTSFTNASLVNGTVYCYKVTAVTAAGKAGPASDPLCAAGYQLATNHTVAYEMPAASVGNQNVLGTSIGLDFDVINPVLIKRLGLLDDRSDGIKLPITIRIWNRDTEEIVAETVFGSGPEGELIEGMRFLPLAQPLRLAAGFHGVVEADGYGPEERIINSFGDTNNVTWTLNSGNGSLMFVGGGRTGAAGQFPASIDGGPPARYAAGTFEFEILPPEFPGIPQARVQFPSQESKATLLWDAVTEPLPAAKYEVERSTAAEGPFAKIGESPTLNYVDSTAQNGTEYYYRVRAVGSGGQNGQYSIVRSVTPNPRQAGIAYHVAPGKAGNQNLPVSSVGMDFDVALPIRITKLGAFDDSSDGIKTNLTVSIYDRTRTDQPVVSIEFTPGSQGDLVEGSRFKALPQPLVLASGFQGSVVVWGYSAVDGVGELLFNSYGTPSEDLQTFDGGSVVFVGSSRYGETGKFPATRDTGPVNRFAGGTFEFEPTAEVVAPVLEYTRTGNVLKLTWSGGGTLQSTPTMPGSWQAVPGAVSGIEIEMTGSSAYYRLIE